MPLKVQWHLTSIESDEKNVPVMISLEASLADEELFDKEIQLFQSKDI